MPWVPRGNSGRAAEETTADYLDRLSQLVCGPVPYCLVNCLLFLGADLQPSWLLGRIQLRIPARLCAPVAAGNLGDENPITDPPGSSSGFTPLVVHHGAGTIHSDSAPAPEGSASAVDCTLILGRIGTSQERGGVGNAVG
jgi:hypothetical protein